LEFFENNFTDLGLEIGLGIGLGGLPRFCQQTLVNYSCAIKNFLKSVKYLEFLAKVYSTVYVKITSYLYCAV